MRALVLLALAASPAAAEPWLALPLDCVPGESCFIQNYVDDDPGPGAADFACGPLSYDRHKGTDFALPSFAAMEAGVSVRAAAPGVVIATRDGMPDLGRDGTPAEALADKDCGNGVVVDHGGGWQTQYCHLREGSVAVARGDRVATGTRLGQVGYSGNTQFPHLHLSLRHDEAVVDPFDPDSTATCPTVPATEDSLWSEPPAYRPGGIIAIGAAPGLPEYAAVRDGSAGHATLPADTPALVGWAYLFGGRTGDRIEIVLTAPDGSRFFAHEEGLSRTQAQLFRAAGKKAPPAGFAPGIWTVDARLLRDGETIDAAQTTLILSE